MGRRAFALVVTSCAVGACELVFPLDVPIGKTVEVSSGTLHSCAIRGDDHTLWCWGRNDDGQLGAGSDTVEADAPKQVGMKTTWASVTAGVAHTCAIELDGSMWCWGNNDTGQLGIGLDPAMLAASPTPQQVAGVWKRVAVGTDHTCAIDTDDHVSCWGNDTNGQLGDNRTGSSMRSIAPTPIMDSGATWIAIDAGESFSCGIQSDGSMWCWGFNGNGRLGIGIGSLESDIPATVAGGDTWTALAAGDNFACALRTDQRMRCWGSNDFGQLGDGTLAQRLMPTPVGSDEIVDWIAIGAGASHACGIRLDRSLACWGFGLFGQLGSDPGTDALTTTPTPVSGGPTVWTSLGLGGNHTCGTDGIAGLWCVGSSGGGELGRAELGSRRTPVAVASVAISTWDDIAVGRSTCANQGTQVECWGDNLRGGVGDGSRLDRTLPVPLAMTWSAISVNRHACAIDSGGLYCWGTNETFELGDDTNVLRSSPTMIGSSTWISVTAGPANTCGLDSMGKLRCWGNNNNGQTGQDPAIDPVKNPLTPINTNIAWIPGGGIGSSHACNLFSSSGGLMADSVACWGNNTSGQLGDPTTMGQRFQPGPVIFPVGGVATDLSTGNFHNFVRIQNQYYAWGGNDHGQLGDGTTTKQGMATAFGQAGQWQQIATGDNHTCGVRTDGTLWCWGTNQFGELGDGSFLERHDPVRVGSDQDWLLVRSGESHTCALKTDHTLWCWGRNLHGDTGDGSAGQRDFLNINF